MGKLLQDVASYLVSGGHATEGYVFRNMMPDTPDNVVVIYEYQGEVPGPGVDVANRSLQIAVRDKDVDTADTKIWAIYNFLFTPLDEIHDSITESRWGVMHARGTPFKLKVDAQKRHIFVFNLGIITTKD